MRLFYPAWTLQERGSAENLRRPKSATSTDLRKSGAAISFGRAQKSPSNGATDGKSCVSVCVWRGAMQSINALAERDLRISDSLRLPPHLCHPDFVPLLRRLFVLFSAGIRVFLLRLGSGGRLGRGRKARCVALEPLARLAGIRPEGAEHDGNIRL
jgi:hypothetical protein